MFLYIFFVFFFFFSSRRRHTRSLCDWSSDVCSSDLTRERSTVCSSNSPGASDIISVPGTSQSASNTIWLPDVAVIRSEEHTSELQSHSDLVCRLLLEKKKTKYKGETARR